MHGAQQDGPTEDWVGERPLPRSTWGSVMMRPGGSEPLHPAQEVRGQGLPRRTLWLRRGAGAGAGIIALGLVWLLIMIQVVARSPGDEPTSMDILLITGPAVSSTLERAEQIVADSDVGAVLLAIPAPDSDEDRDADGIEKWCSGRAVDVPVSCFVPDPYTTAGEIAELRGAAEASGATSVGILTANTRVSRARLLADRCLPFDSRYVLSVDHSPDTALGWVPKFVYETAGFGKAMILRGCT